MGGKPGPVRPSRRPDSRRFRSPIPAVATGLASSLKTNNSTQKQESLQTKDRAAAERIFHARNEAHRQPIINLQIARAYLLVGDPESSKRTWQVVMDEIVKLKHRETRVRWLVAVKDKALDGLRNRPLLETRAQDFLRAMEKGKVSTNMYLRRLHNFALGMNRLDRSRH